MSGSRGAPLVAPALALAGLMLALGGCPRSSPPEGFAAVEPAASESETGDDDASEDEAARTEDALAGLGPAPDPRALALGTIDIGWVDVPGLPRADAVADKLVGRKALDAGDLHGAREAFARALATDPSYAWARYDAALVLAALGHDKRAIAELAELLQTDLPRFGPRVRTDEALAKLREGAHGEDLQALYGRVREAYARAARSGALAWIYQPRTGFSPRTKQPQAPYEDLRLGVLDGGRFVPLSPDHTFALAGLVERDAGRVLIVSGLIDRGDMHVVQPREVGVHLYGVEALGQPIIDMAKLDQTRGPTRQFRSGVAAAIEGDLVRLGYRNLGYEPGELAALVSAEKLRLIDQSPIQPGQAWVLVDGHGVQLELPLAGVAISGRKVEVEGRAGALRLGSAHELPATSTRLERSADGRWLMVLTQVARCAEDGADRRFALSRLDLELGEVLAVASGPGIAGASMAADGSLFFEAGGRVARLPAGEAEAREDVLDRVHLALPAYAYDCGI